MDAAESAHTVCKLRAALARGATLRQAERETGVPASTIRLWARREGVPRRRARRLDKSQRQTIRRAISREKIDGAKATLRKVASIVGCSPSTVWRVANPVEPGAPVRVRPYRCTTCPSRPLVNVRPCPACLALGRIDANGQTRPTIMLNDRLQRELEACAAERR
ncbi:MAG: hypothetical protein M3Q42_11910 [Pseudomonadota bacterium]|nr:hypothetical protein [Pseudomonadota bacterium]